ncbi:hypothetical protein [Virgibacillus salidurans]|nr:hypothetical protein [Virgibacillus sp. NKC19-16]
MSRQRDKASKKHDRFEWIVTISEILLFFPRLIMKFVRWVFDLI